MRLLTRLTIALLIGAGIALYQWSQHVARRHRQEAALQLDRQLGLTAEEIDDEMAANLGVPPGTRGLVVTSLADDRPADRAGIHAGDVIEQIGGLAVTGPRAAVDALQTDRRLRLDIIVNRNGRDLRVEVIRG